jgi:O-acetyl-ADP-ribose deacetylase (regulator of RNase III)
MELAHQHALKTIVFPAIFSRIYAYPIDQAVQIALNALHQELQTFTAIREVIYVCFNQQVLSAYMHAYRLLQR